MPRDNVAIQLDDSLQKSFDTFFNFLPNILAFLVILLIGYIVAKIVKGIVTKGLQKVGLDRHLHESDANQYVQRVMPGASPSRGSAASCSTSCSPSSCSARSGRSRSRR